MEKTSSLIKRRKEVFSSNISLSYNRPIYFKKAAFQYMYDAYGNTFLDAYNNIPHVGHSHPEIVKVSQTQMSKLNTNTRYLYESLYDYSEKLLAKFPKILNKVFFVNSGSEASDSGDLLLSENEELEDDHVDVDVQLSELTTTQQVRAYSSGRPRFASPQRGSCTRSGPGAVLKAYTTGG